MGSPSQPWEQFLKNQIGGVRFFLPESILFVYVYSDDVSNPLRRRVRTASIEDGREGENAATAIRRASGQGEKGNRRERKTGKI